MANSGAHFRWMSLPLLLAIGLITGACSGGSERTTTLDAIRSRGKIVVGTDFEPGLSLRNPTTHRLEGFDVAIAELMAVGIFGGTRETLGAKVEFVETVAKDREAAIDNGNVDIVVASYTINDERKQIVDFAGPYLVTHQDIMVATGDTSINSVADLNEKGVCTAEGTTSAANLAQKAPQAELTLSDTLTECTEALGAGRVAAVSTDETILAGFVAKAGGSFKLVHAPFSEEPYGIGLTGVVQSKLLAEGHSDVGRDRTTAAAADFAAAHPEPPGLFDLGDPTDAAARDAGYDCLVS